MRSPSPPSCRFCSRPLNAVHKSTRLDLMLHEMQMSRAHLYFVTGNLPGAAAAVRAYDQLRTTAPVPDHPGAPRRKWTRASTAWWASSHWRTSSRS